MMRPQAEMMGGDWHAKCAEGHPLVIINEYVLCSLAILSLI